MSTESTEKRNITREDILLQARLGAGAKVTVNGPLLWKPSLYARGPRMVLDGCDMVMHLGMQSNENSPFEIVIDRRDIRISENGEAVATAKLEPNVPWHGKQLADGTPAENVIMGGDDVQHNIIISRGCFTAASGKACHFCGIGPQFESTWPLTSARETLAAAEPQIEAAIIAIQNGWRGFLNLAGGATPPSRRDRWTTDMVEAVMTRFHDAVGADILSELQVAVQVYPPDNLGELDKWKRSGVNSAACRRSASSRRGCQTSTV